jgi:RNA polymerase sigma factor (sigma-70 family)
MYWRRSESSLSRAELEAARLGFLGCLRRKRFSPQFIERNAEDLFGQACFEFTRKLKEDEEIDNPPGWLIECAWRRTKSKLEAERGGPRLVSTEKTEPLPDSASADPEDLLMNADRWRKVRQAIRDLSVEERQLLAASYFEGLSVREAARQLRWHPSKAQRAHERAQDRLHELLGVESSDDLEIEVGLAAYLSVAAEPSTLTAAVQKVTEGLGSLRQQVADGGAQQLKEQAALHYRPVDPPQSCSRPTAGAGARPAHAEGVPKSRREGRLLQRGEVIALPFALPW